MKKITLILITLFAFIYSHAQYVVPRGLPYHDTRFVNYKAPQGVIKVDSFFMTLSHDTASKPLYPAFAYWQNTGKDSTIWLWDMLRWKKIGSGNSEAVFDTTNLSYRIDTLAASIIADTNFIRNQYTIREVKKSKYDSSNIQQLRIGNNSVNVGIKLTNHQTGLDTSDHTGNLFMVADQAAADGTYPAHKPYISFSFGSTGGSGTARGIGVAMVDTNQVVAWSWNPQYIGNSSNARWAGQIFTPDASLGFNWGYGNGIVINKSNNTIWDYATSGTSTFSDSSIRIPNIKTYVSGGQSIVVWNNASKRLELTDGAVGGGTVTSVGLSMPTGFSVASSPVTSSGTLAVTTTLNGILKGDGSGFGTVTIGSGLSYDGTTLTATGTGGTVTSVGLAAPSIFTVTNSPVTTSGTLTFAPNNALGDMIIGSATNTLSYLAGNTTATKKFLTQTGTGTVSAAPSWGTISATDISGISATSPITYSSGVISTSMNTNKLIGRATAGIGVMEEITLGTNLSLSGSTLNATGGGGGTDTVNVANVMSFPGADSTGATDQTSTINAAINYAATHKLGGVYIPHGIWPVIVAALKSGSQTNKQGIQLLNGINLYGDGVGKTIIRARGQPTGDTSTYNWYPIINGLYRSNCKVHDLSIIGNRDSMNIYNANPYVNYNSGEGDTSQHYSVDGIYFKDGGNNKITNIRVDSCQGFGTEFCNTSYSGVINATITTCGSGGMGFSKFTTNSYVDGCFATKNNSDNIRIVSSNSSVIVRNTESSFTGTNASAPNWFAALYVFGSRNTVNVDKIYAHDASAYGLDFGDDTSNYNMITVTNSLIEYNGNGGIVNGGRATIKNNWFKNNGKTRAGATDTHSNYNPGAIVLNNGAYVIIEGNHAIDTGIASQTYFIKNWGGGGSAGFYRSQVKNNIIYGVADTSHVHNGNIGSNELIGNLAYTIAGVQVVDAPDGSIVTQSNAVLKLTSSGGTGAYQTLTDAATITYNVANGYNAKVTLGGNRTLSITNASNGDFGVLIVSQDGTGGRTLTLPAGSKVINGGSGAIGLTGVASSSDILTWSYDGTNYWWTIGYNYN